jgi:hypothetical protein
MHVGETKLRELFDRDLEPMTDRYVAELLEAGLSPEEGEEEAFEALRPCVRALDDLDRTSREL